MPTRPAEILELAKTFSEMGGGEALQRCIVSRAYYACLHAVDETFPVSNDQGRIDGESSHAFIINRATAYGKSLSLYPGRTPAASIGQMMTKLRRFRNAADYDIGDALSGREYADVIKRAEHVISLCQDVERLRLSASQNAVEKISDVVDSVNDSLRKDEKCQKPSLVRIK